MVVLFEPIQPRIHTSLPPWASLSFCSSMAYLCALAWSCFFLTNEPRKKQNKKTQIAIGFYHSPLFSVDFHVLHSKFECSGLVHSRLAAACDREGPVADLCHDDMALSCGEGAGDGRSRINASEAEELKNAGTWRKSMRAVPDAEKAPGAAGRAADKRCNHKAQSAQDSEMVCHLSAPCRVNSCQLMRNHTSGESGTYEGRTQGRGRRRDGLSLLPPHSQTVTKEC